MLNYIWAGLIVLSFVFALTVDVGELASDRYRNGAALPVEVRLRDPYRPDARRTEVTVQIDAPTYRSFFGTEGAPEDVFDGTIFHSAEGFEIRFARDVSLPEPLQTIRSVTAKRDVELLGELTAFVPQAGDTLLTGAVAFRPVRFVRLQAISRAAFEFAETAVTIALGLIGVLALWLGLLRIAEKSGLIHSVVRLVQPVLRPLFPEIPKGHPALGMIALNLTANILGLGNAATPLGIKAMEELQTLNPEKETATNSMVTLLALNTGSVQLVPPTLLVAVMGLQINQLIFAIILATLISTTLGVVAAKLLQRLPAYRRTDPGQLPIEPTA